MKKILSLRVAISIVGLLLCTPFLAASSANAQIPVGIQKSLYRFVTPNSQLSRTFLTTDYQEGVDRGYIFWDSVGVVVVPPAPGWTPVAGQGLAPMYRWRVDHVSGTNYYYSGGLWPNILNNPENHLEGITAYALVPGATAGAGNVLHLWYSQNNGYFYSANGSMTFPAPPPPGSGSWTWQGVAYRLITPFFSLTPCIPATGCFLFQPPAPPPSCNPTQQQTCLNNGGNWNSSNCSCFYPPPPDPCREFELLNNIKTPSVKENNEQEQLPPMPCRQSLPK